MMKPNINFSILLLLSVLFFSCSKDASRFDRQGTTVNNPTVSTGSKDTCTHGRQYYLNFNLNNVAIICNSDLWAGSYFESDIQMNGNFSHGYIYLVAFLPMSNNLSAYPIDYWNSITLHDNGQTYYAGREYADIVGTGSISIDEKTNECVKGSFECKTGPSQYYGTSNIKTIKNGSFHLKRS